MVNDYRVAEGPEGLEKVLQELFLETQEGRNVMAEHYILYVLGNQKSFILVDTTKKPFKFFHYDLLGRPATNSVKNVLDSFVEKNFNGAE